MMTQQRAGFVAWDGEGWTVRGRHEYMLLCNSAGTQYYTGKPLATEDILQTILSAFVAAPQAIHVSYFFGYDVNMILRDVDHDLLRRLHAGKRTRIGPYNVQYRKGKYFWISGHILDESTMQLRRVSGTLWDVAGFFQCAFLKAICDYKVATPAQQKLIEREKKARSTFTVARRKAITRYCRLECDLLVQLCESLYASFESAGIVPRRWDGAGAVAAELLRLRGIKKALPKSTPEAVLDAAQFAYFGGRIELIRFGHTKQIVHHYDINSAYPNVIAHLPCLRHGRWQYYDATHARMIARRCRLGSFACVHVEYAWGDDVLCTPLPWRDSQGRVSFPNTSVSGWYWAPEIAAMLRWQRQRSHRDYRILGAWIWEGECDHTPFDFVPALYMQRQKWKAEGNRAQWAAKLGLNSLYGKMAQRMGADDRIPPYHNLSWAGYVTSATRARLFDVACSVGHEHVIAFATDAIFTTQSVVLPLSNRLGEWSYEQHKGATFVQSGVYWLDTETDTPRAFFRGFDPHSLSHDAILRAWSRGERFVPAESTRFVTMGAVIHARDENEKSWSRWRTWETKMRDCLVQPYGSKRDLILDASAESLYQSGHAGLVPTQPANRPHKLWWTGDPIAIGFGGPSAPHYVPWRVTPGATGAYYTHAVESGEGDDD